MSPRRREIGSLVCALALVLLGTAVGLAAPDMAGGGESTDSQAEPRVTITSPADNGTFAHADLVRIDLAFEGTDTAVISLENTSVAGPDPVSFHVTVHDADGSGNATVYFNPFQGYDGPVTDCDPGVSLAECSAFAVPDDHRNHGFFTHPRDDGSAIQHPDRPAAVWDAPKGSERGGGSAGEYVTPANVRYELSVSAGTDVDAEHRQFPDDTRTLFLDPASDCSMDLLTAPRTGPDALDPGGLERFEDVRTAMERGTVVPPGPDRFVGNEEYVVLDVRAPGLEGILHEAARQGSVDREAALLDGKRSLTGVFRDGVAGNLGGLRSLALFVRSPGYPAVVVDPAASIERVVAGRDDGGHLNRYAVVLRLEPGTAVTRGEDRLSSGMVLNSTFSVDTTGRHRSGLSVVPRDSDQPLPLIACQSEELGWTFYDSTNASISAGFTSPPSTQAVGENVTFNGLRSQGVVGTYGWDFGDGTRATGKSVSHAYDTAGEYTVELTVSGPAGTDTATETVTVVEDPDDPLPDADFSVQEPDSGAEIGRPISLKAALGRQPVEAYEWAFGDGATATGTAVTHTYDEPGEYTISLTVRGIAGENTTQRTVVVGDASEPSVSIEARSGDGSITLRADDEGGAVDRFGWDMGDGTTLAGETVTHRYDQPGEYTVELLATGPGGVDTDSVTVIVEDGVGDDGAGVTVTIGENTGDGTTDDGLGPGFGPLAALSALAAVAALLSRRR